MKKSMGAILNLQTIHFILITSLLSVTGCKPDDQPQPGQLTVMECSIGDIQLNVAAQVQNVSLTKEVRIVFSHAIDSVSAKQNVLLKNSSGQVLSSQRLSFENDGKTLLLRHAPLAKLQTYTLSLEADLKGRSGETFSGAVYRFQTVDGNFTLLSAKLDGRNFLPSENFYNIRRDSLEIELTFSDDLDTNGIRSKFLLNGQAVFSFTFLDEYKTVVLRPKQTLAGYERYVFVASSSLRSLSGDSFGGFSNSFITREDPNPKFPLISDDELLSLIQHQTFRYFYDFAHPASGMARERNSSGDIVTSGGSGFGLMALIVGIERGFITRQEGLARLEKMIHFLETCDRFHGAWPHWLNGNTGRTVPFSPKDDGGDLVETSFVAQGLLTVRQYLNPTDTQEFALIERITNLFNEIEWDWYRKNNANVLYWHWSPNFGWQMNHQIIGYNEALITYVMAASSPTHSIPPEVYHQGFAQNGGIRNGKTFYGYTLPLGFDYGGPLFFAHYSFLGLDPRNLSDQYANYWEQNTYHALINYSHCVANPRAYPNYSTHCWGLTASDIPGGYGVSEPPNDRGVITPTAAVASIPYTPEQSFEAIRFFYYTLGDRLWGPYGFYDAFDVHSAWWADSYLAIDQGPIVIMIENYRTGLLWNLFMSAGEVQIGLQKLGFSFSTK